MAYEVATIASFHKEAKKRIKKTPFSQMGTKIPTS